MKLMVLSSIVALALATPAFAWGERGHSVVAEIAQRNLTPATFAAVRKILGDNKSMASVSSWADDFKFTPQGESTKPWHYVDIDVTRDGYAPSDCSKAGCLVSALRDEVKTLSSASAPVEARRTALVMLIHLVGDSTQPFHCSDRNGDQGGNDYRVDYEGKAPDGSHHHLRDARLHSIWDDTLVMDRAWNWGDYASDLETNVVPEITDVYYGSGFAVRWVDECHRVGQRVYALTPADIDHPVLGEEYQDKVDPIIDQQLAEGGLRLAAMLNAVLGK